MQGTHKASQATIHLLGETLDVLGVFDSSRLDLSRSASRKEDIK